MKLYLEGFGVCEVTNGTRNGVDIAKAEAEANHNCDICSGSAVEAVLATQKGVAAITNMNKIQFTELRRKMES